MSAFDVGVLELRDVDSAGDDLALGPHEEGPRRVGLDVVECGVERVVHLQGVQVDRRLGERQHRDAVVVALEPSRSCVSGRVVAAAAVGGGVADDHDRPDREHQEEQPPERMPG